MPSLDGWVRLSLKVILISSFFSRYLLHSAYQGRRQHCPSLSGVQNLDNTDILARPTVTIIPCFKDKDKDKDKDKPILERATSRRSSLLIMLGLMLRTALKLLLAPFWPSQHYSLFVCSATIFLHLFSLSCLSLSWKTKNLDAFFLLLQIHDHRQRGLTDTAMVKEYGTVQCLRKLSVNLVKKNC